MPSPSDPADLIISVPPITSEARSTAAKLAQVRGEDALNQLRDARAVHKKKLRAWELKKVVSADSLRRAEKQLERINEAAGKTVKESVEGAKKRLMG